jgi:hypothetical protein
LGMAQQFLVQRLAAGHLGLAGRFGNGAFPPEELRNHEAGNKRAPPVRPLRPAERIAPGPVHGG